MDSCCVRGTHMGPEPPRPPELSPIHTTSHAHILSKNHKVVMTPKESWIYIPTLLLCVLEVSPMSIRHLSVGLESTASSSGDDLPFRDK